MLGLFFYQPQLKFVRKNLLLVVLLAFGALPVSFTFAQLQTSEQPAPKQEEESRKPPNPIVLKLNKDGSNFLKFGLNTQTWLRYAQYNPGTVINPDKETTVPGGFDISIRRIRLQMFGKVGKRVYAHVQIGANGLGFNTSRQLNLYMLDLLGEYQIHKTKLHIGAGLTGWSGVLRFSSGSSSSILGNDFPLYQLTTAVDDVLLRKLGVYAKGKFGKFDYRLSLVKPFKFQQESDGSWKDPANDSDFSRLVPNMQWNGYFMYQFFDQEQNTSPYNSGTYLGQKKVLTLGAGFQYQPDAMWHNLSPTEGSRNVILYNGKEVVREDMKNFGVDVFYESPLGSKGSAITAYVAFSSTDYGKDYIQNEGTENPVPNSRGSSTIAYNGSGNQYPRRGTGITLFTQFAYLFPTLGNGSKIQAHTSLTTSRFDKLKNNNVYFWDAGFTWYISGTHHSRITLSYQNRSVFDKVNLTPMTRPGEVILQYQFALF